MTNKDENGLLPCPLRWVLTGGSPDLGHQRRILIPRQVRDPDHPDDPIRICLTEPAQHILF